MFSTAIVVFREAFEIVMIVGIILAATRDVIHRGKAIGYGFAGGLAGALLLAIFTGKISEFAEGMGQEIFNSGILFVAALFIGWTLIWMKRHAREIKSHFQQVGQDVSDGKLPSCSLSIVIALAILREGSEIVLFTYGMLAAGKSPAILAMGSLLGLVAGGLVGALFYMGLLKISTRYFFQVTSVILMFLVAGMMSQAIGFLTSAGAFEGLSRAVWDSSSIISERGIVGQSLGVLIGYTAQPSLIQLIVYLLTLGVLMILIRLSDKKKIVRNMGVVFMAVSLGALVLPSEANATKKIYAPYVEKGEMELEYRGGYEIDDESEVDGAWKQKFAIGYGITDYWFSEVYGEFEKEGAHGADAEFTAVEWENRFQLTQPGEYWLDLGLLAEVKHATAGGPDKAEAKLLLAKDTGSFTHLANIGLEREFGEHSGDDTEISMAWGTRYRYAETFEPGFEIYSEFGPLGDGGSFDEEEHLAGPAFYGQLGPVKYDAAYLFGVSDAAPDGLLKVLLEYEWRF